MLILVSNDDGIYSKGIKILAQALKKVADVVVVAPDREKSAASHSLTLHRPLRVTKMSPKVYAVDGTPTDCITLGIYEILKRKPDLILSGINKGGNLGDDVHYSGTVSAALEGAIAGVPSIAMSLVARDRFIFTPAANFAVKLAKRVHAKGLPKGMILNVNVPNLPENQIRGYLWTKLGKRNYGDIIVEKMDPRGKAYYWIGGDETGFEDIKGSDCNAVLESKISITPLQVDVTSHAYLKKFKGWRL
ncbi:MAG: 5'/3'-nucleotidase SurE [bacterium]